MADNAERTVLTPARRAVLTAVVDTFVPAVTGVDDDPHGFFARSGSQAGADAAVEQVLATAPAELVEDVVALLDRLADLGSKPLEEREAVLGSVARSGDREAATINALRSNSMLLAYGRTDAEGRNPFWPAIGYPGPTSEPAAARKTLNVAEPPERSTADVVVVGSGSGGGVVAGELASAGRKVVVLEGGGYFAEDDFTHDELWSYRNLFLHGGPFPTADGNLVLAAGGSVGGGSTVNWSNCVRPPAPVRARWAEEFGLTGLDGPEFDEHLDAVAGRIGINSDAAVLNSPHQRMFAGAEALGYSHRRAMLNVDARTQDLATIGYSGFGDRSGAKRGTLKTYLQDASDAGATIFPNTRAEKVLLSGGRASGVRAVHTDPDTGRRRIIEVHAEQVVLAAGALETPRVLLNSGIGGAAVGQHLQAHPVCVISGIYPEPMDPWWGPAQSGIVDEFSRREQGHGFLIEGSHHYMGLLTTTIPWSSGREVKELVLKSRHRADFACLVQARGSGSVTLGPDGESVQRYPFDDELDRRNLRDAIEASIRMHHAAGAERIFVGGQSTPPWRRGEDIEEYLAEIRKCRIGHLGLVGFTAHVMSTARLGLDPATSVAGPDGEVHGTPGVWIGDASAFPTAIGVNPMWTIMALARRTAHRMLGRERDAR
ncbi:GMC family oxidoreductase [Saccharopolyspora taberi]|uniref:long-chain-alcohol oxidase n=1 Tax=Saccharopolyspora taberi TaxID=60895 RepID=A0ABN3V3T0_9PSEU